MVAHRDGYWFTDLLGRVTWDSYEWRRCRECRAQVVDGMGFLHDGDCSRWRDDERMHPERPWHGRRRRK